MAGDELIARADGARGLVLGDPGRRAHTSAATSTALPASATRSRSCSARRGDGRYRDAAERAPSTTSARGWIRARAPGRTCAASRAAPGGGAPCTGRRDLVQRRGRDRARAPAHARAPGRAGAASRRGPRAGRPASGTSPGSSSAPPTTSRSVTAWPAPPTCLLAVRRPGMDARRAELGRLGLQRHGRPGRRASRAACPWARRRRSCVGLAGIGAFYLRLCRIRDVASPLLLRLTGRSRRIGEGRSTRAKERAVSERNTNPDRTRWWRGSRRRATTSRT